MRLQSILLTGPLLWTSVSCSAVPLYSLRYVANNEALDDATRAAANFSYHHTMAMLERTHQAILAGDMGQPFLDDTPFDEEQDPDYAAQLAAEKAALQAAKTNQTVEPDAIEGGGSPGEKLRRSFNNIKKQRLHSKRQFNEVYVGVWEDDQSCAKFPPRHKVRETGSPEAYDPDVNAAYDNIQNVINFYRTLFNRNSFDNQGGDMYATVHYCANYNNLFWDGVQMVMGDNDGYVYVKDSYPYSLSFITHEYTHGVIATSNPLFYSGMTGALNEHLADVFGVLSEQWVRNEFTFEASWLVGENTVPVGLPSRTFIAPGTAYNTPALGPDRQVANMSNYYYGPDDNYGVHFNSGIPNHAFYLFARSVGADATGIPAQIWYNTLVGGAGQFSYYDETFRSFADKTIRSAINLGYANSIIRDLRDAWIDVGVLS